MGTRETDQPPLWIATSDLPTSPGHPFYARLTTLLDGHHFDRFVEGLCDRFYAPVMGRPSLAPGRYFRLLLVGYFEGIDSERGIAWRATDSLAVRSFLRLAVDEAPPDHSTIARTRRLIDLETHRTVFTWVQQRLVEAGRLKGKTIAIDATTLEANAAMRSIVRRDTGESYQAFLAGLAKASGIETPTREGLARLDRKRKKKTSNTDWTHPHDPDAKVTKMKDGRTHLAHKAEHAVDMETGAIVAVTLQGADVGDTTTIIETAIAAAEQVEDAQANVDDRQSLEEIVGDKGYHSNQTLIDLDAVGIRSYVSEPDRGRRDWSKDPEARAPVSGNRRRMRGRRGRRLMRQRGERIERSFAHLYDTGGMRRTPLRGHTNILKRLLIHAGGFNLGLVMRHLIGIGTPRGLQGRVAAVLATLGVLMGVVRRRLTTISSSHRLIPAVRGRLASLATFAVNSSAAITCTTGCYGHGSRGIWRVPGTGGTPEQVIPVENEEQVHGPQLLPGGEWVLFTWRPAGASWDQAQIVMQSLETDERIALIDRGRDARYLPTGHLVYGQNSVLQAVPFDLETRQVTGAPVPLVEDVQSGLGSITATTQFSIAATGSLVYVPGGGGTASSLVWVDRQGREERLAAPPTDLPVSASLAGWHTRCARCVGPAAKALFK